ncbi:hypothetical protein KAJ27_13490 [bacterium]|nr:hypothetical protein [bacterium]
MKTRFKVIEVAVSLGVSQQTIYKKLKSLKQELKPYIIKRNGTTYLKQEAIEVLNQNIKSAQKKSEKHNDNKGLNQSFQGENQLKTKEEKNEAKSNNNQGVNQIKTEMIDFLKNELDKRDGTINKQDETIKKLIDRQAESEEKLQTIIMKLTQDLDQTRKLIEDKIVKEEKKKKEPKKTDRVISIQEFINAKIEEDIERSNFEVEKRRLKQKHEDPLQGRSALYKIYVKMFRPNMLRQHAN